MRQGKTVETCQNDFTAGKYLLKAKCRSQQQIGKCYNVTIRKQDAHRLIYDVRINP